MKTLIITILFLIALPAQASIYTKTVDNNFCIGGTTNNGIQVFGCQINGLGYAFDGNECFVYDGFNVRECSFREFSVMLYYFNY